LRKPKSDIAEREAIAIALLPRYTVWYSPLRLTVRKKSAEPWRPARVLRWPVARRWYRWRMREAAKRP
jgi:hypothetical protein